MKFRVLLSKLSIIILLVAILNSIHFTSGSLFEPAMHNNTYTLDDHEVTMTIIGELSEGGGAKDIEIDGDIAYVLSDSGLNIYNVATPANALQLGYYYADGYLGHSIAVYNNYVFTAADDQGLIIIDVTDPSNPIYANAYTNTRPAAISIQDNLLFVANWNNDFEIYNISNVPLIAELIRFEGNGFSYAYSSKDLSFGFANNGSLLVLDINDPENIEKLVQIDDDEISSIAIEGNFWYTGGSNGIKVFNSSILSEPVLVNHFAETGDSFITNLVVLDGVLYASDYHLGFRIFNISDTTLTEIGRNEVGGSPLGFQVDGDIAYVASQESGIQIAKIQFKGVEGTIFGIELILSSVIVLGLLRRRKNQQEKRKLPK
ncbi:MAG: LVIVD repeat-containing protein [Candidatus Hodarchaeales archaeon]|jgi:hypothetical protein